LGENLPAGSTFEMTENGPITSIMFKKWVQHFSKCKAPGKTQFLIMPSHTLTLTSLMLLELLFAFPVNA
jgi:hypothetical protein